MLVYVLVLSLSSSLFLINLDQSSLIIGNVVLSIPSCSYQVKINFLKTADDWIEAAGLWCLKQLLCQTFPSQSLLQCPILTNLVLDHLFFIFNLSFCFPLYSKHSLSLWQIYLEAPFTAAKGGVQVSRRSLHDYPGNTRLGSP